MSDDTTPAPPTPLAGKRTLISLAVLGLGIWLKTHTHLDATAQATVVDLVAAGLGDWLTWGGLAASAYFTKRRGQSAIPTRAELLFASKPPAP
jgi:hypothetical protein